MEELVVEKKIEIHAPASEVWRALTLSEYTRRYMYALDVDTDWKEGSRVVWRGDAGGRRAYRKGKIFEVEPEKYVLFSDFNPAAGADDIDENYMHITYRLESAGNTTIPSVVTDHLNGDETRRKDSDGFWDRVLPALKKMLENG